MRAARWPGRGGEDGEAFLHRRILRLEADQPPGQFDERGPQARFTVSIATAKRDLTSLSAVVTFEGAGEVGYYRLR